MINSYELIEKIYFHAGVRLVQIPDGPNPVMVPHLRYKACRIPET